MSTKTSWRDCSSALLAMKHIGYYWTFNNVKGERSAYVIRKTDGGISTVKILNSSTPSGMNGGRHRYGISLLSLEILDEVLFYAENEAFFITMPCAELLRIYRTKAAYAQLEGRRWVVNIYYNRNGNTELVPVNFYEHFKINGYRHPM